MKTKLLKLALCAVVAALPVGAWADDASNTTTTWLFNQFYNGVILGSSENSAEIKYNFNRMYLALTSGNRTLTAKSESMPNATAPSVDEYTPFAKGTYVGLTFNAKSSTFGNNAADKAGANQQMASMKFSTAGTLYALVKPSYKSEETRTVQIYEGATNKALVEGSSLSSANDDWQLLSCAVTSGYRYFIGSTQASWTLYAVKFVPTTDGTDRTDNDLSVSVKNGYATFSSAYNSRVPTGYKAYVVSSVTDTEATLKNIAHIPANTGVILVADEAKDETVTIKNLRESDISDTDKSNAATNYLVANVGAYELAANNGSNYNYTLAYTTGPVFRHSSGEGTLAGNKAYLRTTKNVVSGADARAFSIVFDDSEATGISETKRVSVSDNRYYNLQGVEVAQPTKGLYIVNGKKVIIK